MLKPTSSAATTAGHMLKNCRPYAIELQPLCNRIADPVHSNCRPYAIQLQAICKNCEPNAIDCKPCAAEKPLGLLPMALQTQKSEAFNADTNPGCSPVAPRQNGKDRITNMPSGRKIQRTFSQCRPAEPADTNSRSTARGGCCSMVWYAHYT